MFTKILTTRVYSLAHVSLSEILKMSKQKKKMIYYLQFNTNLATLFSFFFMKTH